MIRARVQIPTRHPLRVEPRTTVRVHRGQSSAVGGSWDVFSTIL